jgi:hypothetical protein
VDLLWTDLPVKDNRENVKYRKWSLDPAKQVYLCGLLNVY